MSHVAVIDIGKTNAKLALVDPETLDEVAVVTRPNAVVPGPPWPHFDVEGHWAFLLRALRDFHAEHGISAISVTTHGASAALIGQDGALAAPVLDYEFDGPDALALAYAGLRPDFAETGSPKLAGGLNVGAQLYWQFQSDPGLKARVRYIVTYPQYWGYRLTGVAATDVTSLGCHTDLWDPYQGRPSSLVEKLGIGDLLAPTLRSGEVLGHLLPEIARHTGLSQDTPVYCGIHDSNASLLPHLLKRKAPFGVVSTGTWVIAMAVGGASVRLDPAKDTLVNVNALGDPVPSARFMGGREYDVLSAGQGVTPTLSQIAAVLEHQMMILPAAVPDTGPFQDQQLAWVGGPEPAVGSGTRSVCIGFYLALVTAHCLDLVGQRGPIVVEGPFARNPCFLDMLSAATRAKVIAAGGATGTSQGAAMLAQADRTTRTQAAEAENLPGPIPEALGTYAALWAERVAARL